jgi:small subunit ribosomal protein S16
VRAILKLKGVYYKKHLQRGVLKGAFDQEAADKMLAEWLDAKSAKIEKRKEATKNALEDRRAKIFGVAPVVEVKVEEVVEETVTEEPVAVETATEETATEETATEEAVVEETKPEETVVETTENTEKKDA